MGKDTLGHTLSKRRGKAENLVNCTQYQTKEGMKGKVKKYMKMPKKVNNIYIN